MKLLTKKEEFDSLPYINQLFWKLWFLKKGYPQSTTLDIGQLMEVSFALPNTLHYDTAADRIVFPFNNHVEFESVLFAFDGDEPIDSYFYEVNNKLTAIILGAMKVKNLSHNLEH